MGGNSKLSDLCLNLFLFMCSTVWEIVHHTLQFPAFNFKSDFPIWNETNCEKLRKAAKRLKASYCFFEEQQPTRKCLCHFCQFLQCHGTVLSHAQKLFLIKSQFCYFFTSLHIKFLPLAFTLISLYTVFVFFDKV